MRFINFKPRVNKANGQINLSVLKKKVPKKYLDKMMLGNSFKIPLHSFEFEDRD